MHARQALPTELQSQSTIIASDLLFSLTFHTI